MPEKKKVDGLVDIAEIAKADLGTSPEGQPPPLLRVGQEPLDIRVFTLQSVEAHMHWMQVDGSWMTFLCNDKPCTLCMAKNSPIKVLLLPVLDAVAREVGLLAIPRNRRAGSLLDALRPFLKEDAGNQLLEVSRSSSRRHQVTPLAADDDLDLGDDIIRAFLGRLDGMSGDDLTALYRGVYRRLTNQELLRDFPELAARIRHRHPDLDLKKL